MISFGWLIFSSSCHRVCGGTPTLVNQFRNAPCENKEKLVTHVEVFCWRQVGGKSPASTAVWDNSDIPNLHSKCCIIDTLYINASYRCFFSHPGKVSCEWGVFLFKLHISSVVSCWPTVQRTCDWRDNTSKCSLKFGTHPCISSNHVQFEGNTLGYF